MNRTGIRTKVMTITPKMASAWLTRNYINRPIKEARVKEYSRQLEEGIFDPNGSTIVFDSDGYLRDGQHRLSAVLLTQLPMTAVVVFGISPDAALSIDTGSPRSPADVMRIAGNPCTHSAATAAGILLRLAETGEFGLHMASRRAGRRGAAEIARYASTLNTELLYDVQAMVHRIRVEGISRGAMIALGYLAGPGANGAKFEEFTTQLATAEGLHAGDPAHTLLRWLRGSKKQSKQALSYAMTLAWSAFANGEKLHRIRTTGDLEMPQFPVGQHFKFSLIRPVAAGELRIARPKVVVTLPENKADEALQE